MLDQDTHRLWADHHSAFTGQASDAWNSIFTALQVLQHKFYDAPWRNEANAAPKSAELCA